MIRRGSRVANEAGGRAGTAESVVFTVSDQSRDAEWDALLDTIPGSHFEQMSGWSAAKARYGWLVMRILAWKDGLLVGGIQAPTRRIGRLGTIGYVARGPAVAPGHEELELRLAARLIEVAKADHWLYCVFDHAYHSHALAVAMATDGFIPHPAGIPPSGLLSATVVVDLRPDEDRILSRMNASVRRNIRRAQRSDLTFGLGRREDILRFRELMLATCARRQAAPTPPQRDYFFHLWEEMSEKGWVQLFLVRSGDEVVSAAFAFTISDTVRVWKVGWSGEHGDKDPNHLLWWQIMRWAKAHGFQALDFVWLDTGDATRAARGERSPDGFRDGTSYFKLGFGGELLLLPGAQSCFLNPFCNFALQHGGARILASPAFQQLLSRVWAHSAGQ